MEPDDKKVFWRFTIRYNVFLLGGLYFAFLAVATSALEGHFDGKMVHRRMLIYVFILLLAFVSWVCCVWKSWKLTKFDGKLRMGVMVYLFGTPLFLIIISGHIAVFILRLMGVSVPFD